MTGIYVLGVRRGITIGLRVGGRSTGWCAKPESIANRGREDMRSNFESPLKIVDGAVRARGRLNWEGGESESLVSVSISQKQHNVAGMATSPDEFEKPKRTWTLDIDPGYGKFKPGPANAVGIICAMGSEVRVFFWSQEVELKKA
jgi:hypothetical protein